METNVIEYYKTIRHVVSIPGTKRAYVFEVRATICAALVQEQDVEHVLGLKGGCCGKKHVGVYFRPNEQHLRIWTNGGGS